MSCGSAIGCSSSQALKDHLQMITSGNDNTDTNGRASKTAILGPNSLTGFWIQDVKAVSLMPGGPALSGK